MQNNLTQKIYAFVERLSRVLHIGRGLLLFVLICLLLLISVSWVARLAVAPARRARPYVSLEPYGYAGVEMRLVHPARINYRQNSDDPALLTVYARADAPDALTEIDLVLPLPDESLAFVDAQGMPVPGRLDIIPGYPDALPYNLQMVHTHAQLQSTVLRSRLVRVTPLVQMDGQIMPVPELAFRTRLESGPGYALRRFVLWFSGWGLFFIALGMALVVGGARWRQKERERRLAREQRLSALYTRLRDEIKVENWAEARARVEELRMLAPAYRDLARLDTMISTAETATWRREQLYSSGVRAYNERDWPGAVQAFQGIEQETPYYHDVRFLRRTAALYADLRSRDRSLRILAAQQLGEVADLIDMVPLLQALGDRSREVADAAEASFARIGAPAADTLLNGLAADSLAVRERSYRLLQSMGQSVRDHLLGALYSDDPRITAPVARLLRSLGARQALVDALLRVGPEHQEAIVNALVQEGQAAAEPLVEALLKTPPEREPVLIGALAALKTQVDISHYLETQARASDDDRAKALLQRVARAPAQEFSTGDRTKEAVELRDADHDAASGESGPEAPEPPNSSPRSLMRRLGLLDRRET